MTWRWLPGALVSYLFCQPPRQKKKKTVQPSKGHMNISWALHVLDCLEVHSYWGPMRCQKSSGGCGSMLQVDLLSFLLPSFLDSFVGSCIGVCLQSVDMGLPSLNLIWSFIGPSGCHVNLEEGILSLPKNLTLNV